MNIKVVLIWTIGIIVFFGLALFGFFNQDLLVKPEIINNEEKHEVQYVTKTCMGNNASIVLNYNFKINPNNQIERVFIKSTNSIINDEIIAAANQISETINLKQSKGLNVQVSEKNNNIIVDFNANILDYDEETINELQESLLKLGLVIQKNYDFDSYRGTLGSTTGILFNCY